jgi:hypothetical protein
MRMPRFRRQSRNPDKRGARWDGRLEPPIPAGGVSCAAHGHRPRNPRPSRGRFPGPTGHRGLMARDAWAAGRVAGSGVGVVCRAPHTVHHPRGSGKTGRKAASSWHGGLCTGIGGPLPITPAPPIPSGPP